MSVDAASIKLAQEQLDARVREIVAWHFSPDTGSDFWLDWAKRAGFDPRTDGSGALKHRPGMEESS